MGVEAGQPQVCRLLLASRFARRITASTPCSIGGPAAGHPMMKTAADPAGRIVLGTIGNCASGMTPWGTYLSGEENWANYFSAADTPTGHENRWGIRKATWYRWPEFDARFDTVRNPNGSVGAEDLDAFIGGFIAANVLIADVASDSLDTTFNPNGSVGAEDLAKARAFVPQVHVPIVRTPLGPRGRDATTQHQLDAASTKDRECMRRNRRKRKL